MQHISLTMRKMKLLALLLAMVVMPNVGFCQNTTQKVMKVDTVKRTTPIAVSPQRSVTTTTSVEVANPTMITYNDTILCAIQDTLNQIAERTRWEFLGAESTKSNSWIGLLALIVGTGAAYFAWKGYVYQRKSAKSLEQMENKRLPFMVFAKKIFENVLTLDILTEIETTGLDPKKEERRDGYQVDRAIDGLRMPDDLIELRCYESFKDSVYVAAINLKVSWRNYNKRVDELAGVCEKGEYGEALSLYQKLRQKTVLLLQEFFEFEDLIMSTPIGSSSVKKTILRHYYFSDIYTDQSGKHIPIYYKPINSKMRFLSQLLVDSFRGNEQRDIRANRGVLSRFRTLQELKNGIEDIPWVADCKVFRHDISTFGFCPELPINSHSYKMIKEKMWYANRNRKSWHYIRAYFENPFYLQDCFHGWPQPAIGLFRLIYDSIGEKKKENYPGLWNKIYDLAWKNYFFSNYFCIIQNNTILLRMMYNLEMGIRRKSMIDDVQFQQSECLYFAEEYYRYNSFHECFVESPLLDVSFRDLIYAVVAEQSTSFDAVELNVGVGEKKMMRKHINVNEFIPVLETIGVMRLGEIVVRSKGELDAVLQKYHREEFSYPLDDCNIANKLNEHFIRRNKEIRHEKRWNRKMQKRRRYRMIKMK